MGICPLALPHCGRRKGRIWQTALTQLRDVPENGTGKSSLGAGELMILGSCFGALAPRQALCAVMDGLPLCFVLLGRICPEEQRTLME